VNVKLSKAFFKKTKSHSFVTLQKNIMSLIKHLPVFLFVFLCISAQSQTDTLKMMLGKLGSGSAADSVPLTSSSTWGKITIHPTKKIDSLEKAMRNGQVLEGWRIHVFMGTYQTVISERKKFIALGTSLPAYPLQNGPDYVLVAGDFRTFLESQKWLGEIRKHYPGAFVIQGEIEPPEFMPK